MQAIIKLIVKKHLYLLLLTLATVIALKVMVLAPALLIGRIVDVLSAVPEQALGSLAWLTGAFILAGIFQAAITPLQIRFLSKLVQSVIAQASIDWVSRLMDKEFSQFSTWRIGHVIKSVERGITAHEQWLTFLVTLGLPIFLECLIVGSVFYLMGGGLIFLAMTSLAVAYFFIVLKIIRWRRKHIDSVNKREDELSALLFNTLSAGKVIKLELAKSTATRPMNLAITAYAKAAVTTASSGGLLNAAKLLFISGCTGGLLTWGVADQLSNPPALSVGQLVAVFSIAGGYLLNITALVEGYRMLDQFRADQMQLEHLLSQPDFGTGDERSSGYSKGESTLTLAPCEVLDEGMGLLVIDETLSFTSHETVAITGSSGAGKSTLLEVLVGINDKLRNRLSLNGVPIDRMSAEQHLKALRYCPQSPVFLEGEFDCAVLFDAPRARCLDSAIHRLQLEEVIAQRVLRENATNISGGEAKRLSLLRLINCPGQFNFFDEPSASVEPRLAGPVWDLLFDTFAGRGLICVTHDLAHLHRFDRVIVMREGRVVEDGSWQALIDRPGLRSLLNEV